MREIHLLNKFFETYRSLGLNNRKLGIAFCLMLFTSILEMTGLSILYPLVLAMQGDTVKNLLPLPETLSEVQRIQVLLIGVAVLYVVKNIALYFTYQNNINFAVYYYNHLVRGLYRSLLSKTYAEFQRESPGSLSHLICVQSEKFVDGTLRPFLVITSELFLLLSISALVFFVNPLLMTCVLGALSGSAISLYIFFRNRAHQWGQTHMRVASELQEQAAHTAEGICEIKVFAKEEYLVDRLWKAVQEKTRMFHHLEMFQQSPRYLAETVFIVTVVVFYSVKLSFGMDTKILMAQFSVMAAASFRILPCINRIVNSYSTFSFNVGPSLSLLDTIIGIGPLASSKTSSQSTKSFPIGFRPSKIEVLDLSFRFSKDNFQILEQLTMTFRAGQRVGLVGPSGSGKSTLIKLLAGLYDPTSGKILIDGNSILDHRKAWQSLIGYVRQESFILPGSIKENVLFGTTISQKLRDTDSEIWDVLEKIGMHSFVSKLSHQLDTRIGEKGLLLSGGQRQLLCLARALFRRPKVILLDEPTASLDPENEKTVLKVIEKLPRETFLVMSSHKHDNFRTFDSVYRFNLATKSFEESRVENSSINSGNAHSLEV